MNAVRSDLVEKARLEAEEAIKDMPNPIIGGQSINQVARSLVETANSVFRSHPNVTQVSVDSHGIKMTFKREITVAPTEE
jgi:hypothetical protein